MTCNKLVLSCRWKVYAEGVPHCVDVEDDDIFKLPANDRYSLLKEYSFGYNLLSTYVSPFFCEKAGVQELLCRYAS